jgi:hypothetical protein
VVQLIASASIVGNRLRLTPADVRQAVPVRRTTRSSLASGFDATFTFRLGGGTRQPTAWRSKSQDVLGHVNAVEAWHKNAMGVRVAGNTLN